MSEGTYRVIREDEHGELVTETLLVRPYDGLRFPWFVKTDEGAVGGVTPRDAVARYARMAAWTAVEILAPGELSRAELAAEVARLRGLVDARNTAAELRTERALSYAAGVRAAAWREGAEAMREAILRDPHMVLSEHDEARIRNLPLPEVTP